MKAPARIAATLMLCTLALSGCAGLVSPQTVVVSQVNKADDAQAKSDVASAKVAILSALIADGTLPTMQTLADYGFAPSEGLAAFNFTGSGQEFCVEATSKSGATFHATESTELSDGPCL